MMAALQGIVMTPITPATGCMAQTDELISPQTRRILSIQRPTLSVPPQQLTEQSDTNERRARRKSRLLEMHQARLSSPSTPTDKRKSLMTPSKGLTNAQLTDLYANCIKLSTENKINAKNAFGLHLIDYLSELLKKKEMNNFQVASSTLDASAKIYAGRVDAIHTETYKVLTGLSRGNEPRDKEAVADGDSDGESVAGDARNKKGRAKRKKTTLETNLKNINIKKFDMEFEVDPLFQKTSATFDEGGTGGLLLNQLACLDDTSAIVVDLDTEATTHFDLAECERRPTSMKDFNELYKDMALQELDICPEFSDFNFTNWSKEDDDAHTTIISRMSKDERRFDVNAVVEAVPEVNNDDNNDDVDLDVPIDDFTCNEDDPIADNADGTMVRAMEDGSLVINMESNKDAHLVVSALTNCSTDQALISALSTEPSEYSYFSGNILQSWAGPEHWKIKPTSKETDGAIADPEKKVMNKKTRKRKEPFQLVVDAVDEPVVKQGLKESTTSSMLTKRTLLKNSKICTSLPENLQYDAMAILQLSINSKVMVKMTDSNTSNVDDGVQGYDYANVNDKENFVPQLQDVDDDVDADEDNDRIDFGDVFSQSQEDQDAGPSEPGPDGDANETVFRGDNLVEQPRKIAKIDINYTKTSKRIDVKKLKESMWSILCTKSAPTEKINKGTEDAPCEEEGDGDGSAKATGSQPKKQMALGQHLFSDVVRKLPSKVSQTMAKNLSVPIAFVCLLQLANEKMLKIDGEPDMSDLRITQG